MSVCNMQQTVGVATLVLGLFVDATYVVYAFGRPASGKLEF